MWKKNQIEKDFKRIIKNMELEEWDIKLEFIEYDFKNTGNIKIDLEDKSAIVYLNIFNPKSDNYEEILIHELCHLKLWKLDQYCESLLNSTFDNQDSKEYRFAYDQFMINLEQTTQELTKTYLPLIAKNKNHSFVRCEKRMKFKEE